MNSTGKSNGSGRKVKNQAIIDGWLLDAVTFQRDGNLDAAERLYQKVLLKDPGNADALHMQGLIEFSRGEIEDATLRIEKAIASDPSFADFYKSLGRVKKRAGCLEDALINYQKAISIKSTDMAAIYEAASINHQIGKLKDAEALYKKCIQLSPDHAGAMNGLGLIYKARKQFLVAQKCFQRALEIDPDLSVARSNLAVTLKNQGRTTEALNELERIVTSDPGYPEAYYHLGLFLSEMGDSTRAIGAYEKAISLKEDFSLAYNNWGILLQERGRTKEAASCFQKTINLDPNNARAYYNLGVLHKYHGRSSDAVDCLKAAQTIDPGLSLTDKMMRMCLRDICQWPIDLSKTDENEDLRADMAALAEDLFDELFDDYSEKVFRSAKKRSKDVQQRSMVSSPGYNLGPGRYKGEKVIVGYLSNNFRDHPTSHLIVDMFAYHDRHRYEINCFSYGDDDQSIYRKEIERRCDRFVDLFNVSSMEAATKIHQTNTQILIDLNGYTACSRTEICAFRPSPIQVRYLGEAKTTGACFFDYIVTDTIVTPLDCEAYFSEKLVQMPHSYQVNSTPRANEPIIVERQRYGLPSNGFVFCSFATGYKIDPELFVCWIAILKQTPGSVLWLLKRDAAIESNLKSVAAKLGMDQKRLIFSTPCAKPEHLARLSLADLCLDTRVVNGAATTSDALWAGVPVVTVKGGHFASRMSASILSAVGLSELITDDLEQYEKLVVALATDGDRLKALRKKLAQNKYTEPLFDTKRFVRNLENAFEEMWAIYQAGEPPRHIQVKDCGPSADMHAFLKDWANNEKEGRI